MMKTFEEKIMDKVIDQPSMKSAQDELISQLKETFMRIDTRKDGLVSKEELKKVI